MGYRSIPNLYACPQFVGCEPEVWVLEKIEGTSAHVARTPDGQMHFFHGESREQFLGLFDEELLKPLFEMALVRLESEGQKLTVYGEHYGGKVQGMRDTYGDRHRFVAFEVKVGEDGWLPLEKAREVVEFLGLEFVHAEKVPFTLEELDRKRDEPSVQSVRCGIPGPKAREGIVIRLDHLKDREGNPTRIKHKNAEFVETKSVRKVTPSDVQRIIAARAVADEYVTENRLKHVLQDLRLKLGRDELTIKDTGDVCRQMVADVRKEALPGEVDFTPGVDREVGTRAALLYKKSLGFFGAAK